MPEASKHTKASVTIKSRPRADGSVSWFLWIRRTRPQRDELVPVLAFTKVSDRPAVEAFAKPYRKALAKGLSEPQPETCDEWYARYAKHQLEAGRTDPTNGTRWTKWISPRIGTRQPATITRDDIEDIRDALDVSVRAWMTEGKGGGRISGKTAMNVWSALTSAFKAATSSKRRDLRVLDGKANPCVGVEPPGDRESRKARRKLFVYPKECAAVLAFEEIPLEWREAHALAAYTYLRPGELRVLTWADVDIAAMRILVTKAWDYNAEAVKPPKTRNGVRHVPIEAALVPLLERMRKGKAPTALVVPALEAFGEDHLAELFREHLLAAGVTRAELHASTKTHVQSNFRSWRDSGITWLAISGLGVDKIMRRAGHDTTQTTMGYVKLAEDLGGDLGAPFAPLPASLIDPTNTSDGSQGPCEPSVNREPSPAVSACNDSAFQQTVEREKGFETEAKAGSIEGSATPSEPIRRELTTHDDTRRDRSHLTVVPAEQPVTVLDVPRAAALASAVDGFVRAGMLDHARPLAAELATLLRAAEGTGAAVAVLGTKRERR